MKFYFNNYNIFIVDFKNEENMNLVVKSLRVSDF